MATWKMWLIPLVCLVVLGGVGAPARAAHLTDYNDFAVCVLDALQELKACLVVAQTENEGRTCYRQYIAAQKACASHCPKMCPLPAD
jgi:hypothetical protein